ncbi:MAG: hypothetical protein KAH95_08795, partial [Spirochaetales bacterium]|nr:hypothetical protein [Spirochaetales bacterium]
MEDIDKAKELFTKAGLKFPKIPEELSVRLKEKGKWLFSTKEIDKSPYNLQHYTAEADKSQMDNYAILAHSGHGSNSYAIQYYLVYGMLEMFLHIGWGGIYMNPEKTAATIESCFSLSDKIIQKVQVSNNLKSGTKIRIVGTDFYKSYWTVSGTDGQKMKADSKDPIGVLTAALNWLQEGISENIEYNKPPAPKGILKKSFSFKLFEHWADELYDAINEFYNEFSIYPNIISAMPKVYKEIDTMVLE